MKMLLVLILVAAVAFAAFNVHTCEGCGELFFGKAHATETWGDICSECYRLYGGVEDVFGEDFLEGILG